jgi:hypothetical protein
MCAACALRAEGVAAFMGFPISMTPYVAPKPPREE